MSVSSPIVMCPKAGSVHGINAATTRKAHSTETSIDERPSAIGGHSCSPFGYAAVECVRQEDAHADLHHAREVHAEGRGVDQAIAGPAGCRPTGDKGRGRRDQAGLS